MMTYMNTGKPFSIVYVTWDHAKGAGGAVKEIQLATKHYNNNRSNATPVSVANNISTTKTNPNHFSNSTFNIKIPGSGAADIRKVHVQLIRRFNGAIVK